MVSALFCGMRSLGSHPGQGRCVVFFGKNLTLTYCLSPHRCINEYWKIMLGITLRWTSMPSRGGGGGGGSGNSLSLVLVLAASCNWPDGLIDSYAESL